MLPLPENYVNSICEIKTMENELVATGTISEITTEYIQIRDKSGAMSIVHYGTMVKINVFNFRLGFRVLVGKVYLSTADLVRVMEITSLLDYERRNFFRVDTNIRATVEPSGGARPGEEPQVVRVRDISLGGAMFASELTFERDYELLLKLHIGHLNTSLPCAVRRVVPEEDGKTFRYGCEFISLTDAQNGAICSYIFQRQREQINKNKQ